MKRGSTERSDRKLVKLFVERDGHFSGRIFPLDGYSFPEDEGDNGIDILACDSAGKSLAIEYTLIEPYIGERDEAHKSFGPIMEQLEQDVTLAIPGYRTRIWYKVGSIPMGTARKALEEVREKLREWWRNEGPSLPEKLSHHKIPGLPIDITLSVEKWRILSNQGKVVVGRTQIPNNFLDVVREALSKKLPKLVATLADERFLLFEQNIPASSEADLYQALCDISAQFPDLGKIDAIWAGDTVARERGTDPVFVRIWPEGNGWWDYVE